MKNNYKWKNDSSQIIGAEAEERFIELVEKNGKTAAHSNVTQNRYEHWDFEVDGEKIEVKSRKRAKRSNQDFADDWIYVEFQNVSGGLGWLYGKADKIAFEQPDGFLLVAREDLMNLAERLVKCGEWVTRPTPYKSYKRRDRPNEWVSVLMLEDVLTLEHSFLK